MVTRLVATGAVAAALLTGCTPTAGEPPTTHLAAGPPPATDSQWVAAGDRTWRSDLVGELAAPPREDGTLRLGSPLLQAHGWDNDADFCSAGALFRTPSGDDVLLSAAHCDHAVGDQAAIGPRTEASRDELIPAGTYTKRDANGRPLLGDNAVLRLNTGVARDDGSFTEVARQWPVSGVLSAASAPSIPERTSVCVVGAKIGVGCGPLVAASSDYASVDLSGLFVDGGDSGGSAWLVDEANKAVLLGTVVRGAQSQLGTRFTIGLVEPAVRALDLRIVEG